MGFKIRFKKFWSISFCGQVRDLSNQATNGFRKEIWVVINAQEAVTRLPLVSELFFAGKEESPVYLLSL